MHECGSASTSAFYCGTVKGDDNSRSVESACYSMTERTWQRCNTRHYPSSHTHIANIDVRSSLTQANHKIYHLLSWHLMPCAALHASYASCLPILAHLSQSFTAPDAAYSESDASIDGLSAPTAASIQTLSSTSRLEILL